MAGVGKVVENTEGRTAIVTGGTGGLGAAVTAAFLEGGWRVVVPWVAEAELERVERREGLELVQADLMDPGSAAEVARAAGPATRAVVNLVGGFAMGGRVHETPVDEFEAQLRLNLRPTYLVTAAALPAMLAAGEGAVVCVSSRAALRPFAGAAGYVTAKAAVLALVDALHAEYVGDGLRVNAVLPSVIDTPANRASMPDADFDTWVRPAQIARVVRFLCSDDAAVTSGAHVPVYGRA
ncbi:MAG: SDR family NAD(P)-dependent oxidoreductase [Solirubrobacterales bacterium]|nr:SDR family NAD(P)-dependent oxidoreductase [Solirubrobacterales bacterium]